jgi:hypothetical protein
MAEAMGERTEAMAEAMAGEAMAEEEFESETARGGGYRYRENLGKYVVEYRPPRFKWKLWMGTYATADEARRAFDCARFYTCTDPDAPDDFYFTDSPALFGKLGPLSRPFTTVGEDVKDKAFNVELKRRAKLVIRNLVDAQGAPQSVEV